MIADTTTAHGLYYSTIRTEYTAPHGTKFVFVTLLNRGPVRIEVYQVDPESGIEMWLQFANPDLLGVPEAHGLVSSALLVHMSEVEKRGYQLTPMADWP